MTFFCHKNNKTKILIDQKMVPGTEELDDEGADKSNSNAVCVITNSIKSQGDVRTLRVGSNTTGQKLLQVVGCAFNSEPNELVLVLHKDSQNRVLINDHLAWTIEEIGLNCDGMSDNFLDIVLKKRGLPEKFGRSRTTCTTETVEIQRTKKGSSFIQKTSTSSVKYSRFRKNADSIVPEILDSTTYTVDNAEDSISNALGKILLDEQSTAKKTFHYSKALEVNHLGDCLDLEKAKNIAPRLSSPGRYARSRSTVVEIKRSESSEQGESAEPDTKSTVANNDLENKNTKCSHEEQNDGILSSESFNEPLSMPTDGCSSTTFHKIQHSEETESRKTESLDRNEAVEACGRACKKMPPLFGDEKVKKNDVGDVQCSEEVESRQSESVERGGHIESEEEDASVKTKWKADNANLVNNCSNDTSMHQAKNNYWSESTVLSEPSKEICRVSEPEPRHSGTYVGLVNQAMTCYLNSLLQTLYMTPEFRNALYRWKFDNNKEERMKNIPFQLQKLFLQLQMSKKCAVGTTELTHSFGWNSNEAWQQQDVQDMYIAMFDALEQRLAKTDQANLIDNLYKGKMKDYVKCLECGYESAREDTFLDIPLVVIPFGSTQAYGSVEEALRAFVAPETLIESNQYFCEKCDKKCDAHKGLKFTRFPYLLTLHLKRFDFDPMTMHRIKLNNKVTFPQVLNLNEFVKFDSETLETAKSDIMMDSGSGFDEEASYKGSSTPSRDDEGEILDIDEGIDVISNGNQDLSTDEKNFSNSLEKLPGPFVYELFSIMVHSGSANGGHYYAYIKSFSDGNWFCFNDVQVSQITHDDIRRTYGGGNARGYCSSTYTSSTNAYMLMYRQIDKDLNAVPMDPLDFPPHIRELLVDIEEMERKEQEQLELEKAMCKVKLFCNHPVYETKIDRRLVIHKDATLLEATGTAYELLGLSDVVSLDCCRLVKYDEYHESVENSFDNCSLTIGEILGGAQTSYNFGLLLEIKKPDETFISYLPGGITIKLRVANLENEELSSPLTLRILQTQTVAELKQQIAKQLELQSPEMRLVMDRCRDLHLLTLPNNTLASEGFTKRNKVFVEYNDADDANVSFEDSKFYKLLDVHEHTISVLVTLPKVDKNVLTGLGFSINGDRIEKVGSGNEPEYETELGEKQVKCEPENYQCGDDELKGNDALSTAQSSIKATNSDHSENSSLSSLTDSERTLVGDEMSPRNNSPVMGEDDEYWDDNGFGSRVKDAGKGNSKVFFKAVPAEGVDNALRVFVDARITLGELKKQLEPFVGIGTDSFKLFRIYTNDQEFECTRLTENMMSYNEKSTLAVKLGKALQKGEYRVKVYQLLVNDAEPCRYLADMVFMKGMTVRQAKKAILPELIAKCGVDVTLNRCRLRKKKWKNPGAIFLDSQRFQDDITIYPNWEVFLEVLPEAERVTNSSQLSVFLRTWHPSTLKLSPLTEIVLNGLTFDELKMKSSEVSGIPVENLQFTKGMSTFPCEMRPSSMQTEMEWHSDIGNLSSGPLYISEDGCVLSCRDKTEILKELSEEEKKSQCWDAGSNTFSKPANKTYFSPQKEKALKIYTDSPPSNTSQDTNVPKVDRNI